MATEMPTTETSIIKHQAVCGSSNEHGLIVSAVSESVIRPPSIAQASVSWTANNGLGSLIAGNVLISPRSVSSTLQKPSASDRSGVYICVETGDVHRNNCEQFQNPGKNDNAFLDYEGYIKGFEVAANAANRSLNKLSIIEQVQRDRIENDLMLNDSKSESTVCYRQKLLDYDLNSQAVVDRCNSSTLTTSAKNREYNRLLQLLTTSALPIMEARITSLGESLQCGIHATIQLVEVAGLEAETGELKTAVEDLRAYGADLVNILDELDCSDTPKSREIKHSVEEVRARYERLIKSTAETKQNIEVAVTRYEEARTELRALLVWIQGRENAFTALVGGQTIGRVSLNRTFLLEQIVASHDFGKDVKCSEPRVADIVQRCLELGIAEHVHELSERYATLLAGCRERDHRLEEMRLRLAQVYKSAESLRSWTSDSVQALEVISGVTVTTPEQGTNHVVTSSIESKGKSHTSNNVSPSFSSRTTATPVRDMRSQAQSAKHHGSLLKSSSIEDTLSSIDKKKKIHTEDSPSRQADNIIALRMTVERLYVDRIERLADFETLKKSVRELVSDNSTDDRGALRDLLADIQSRWNILMDQLIAVVASLAEKDTVDLTANIDKSFAEIIAVIKISSDLDEMETMLQAHLADREEAYRRREAVAESISKVELIHREFISSESLEDSRTEAVMSRLRATRCQLDQLCTLHDSRIAQLREVLPLVTHIIRTHDQLLSCLDNDQSEIDAMEWSNVSVELSRLQRSALKTIRERLDDYRLLVDELTTAGEELGSLCSPVPGFDCQDIAIIIGNIADRYTTVKHMMHDKQSRLDEIIRRVCSDTSETVSSLMSSVQRLSSRLDFFDGIAANPFVLRQQIAEINELEREAENLSKLIEDTSIFVNGLVHSDSSEETTVEHNDLTTKISNLRSLLADFGTAACARAKRLNEAAAAAEKFFNEFLAISEALHGIKDRLLAEKLPHADLSAVKEQLQQLSDIRTGVQTVCEQMSACTIGSAKDLIDLCGLEGSQEVEKFTEDFDDLKDEINDRMKERESILVTALERAENLSGFLQVVASWLPDAERRLKSMAPISASARSVRIQIEEFKVFKVQMYPWYSDMHNLNQYMHELKTASLTGSEEIILQMQSLNERWTSLVQDSNQREVSLKTALIELGEVDHALEDVMGLLQQVETDLVKLDQVYGDPRYIEVHLRKVETLLKELSTQRGIIVQLSATVVSIVERSGATWSPLAEREHEMMSTFSEVEAIAKDRRDELLDRLKEVRGFVNGVDELTKWINEYRRRELKLSRPKGALVDSTRAQYNRSLRAYEALENKATEVDAMVLNGDDMFARCQENEAKLLRQKLSQLKLLVKDTRERASKIMSKMVEHLKLVEAFHKETSKQTDWLTMAERTCRSLRRPGRLPNIVQNQLRKLNEFRVEIAEHSAALKKVDQTGTHLKYFGSRQDAVYLKDYLLGVRIRWKKLAQNVDTAEQSLHQGYWECKRFFDSWTLLTVWLDDSQLKLRRYLICSETMPKQDTDELKRYELQMSNKYPSYAATQKHGTSLRDRCDRAAEHERTTITDMLSALVSKWTDLRAILSQRADKVEESLLTGGSNSSSAIDLLLNWLNKALLTLANSDSTNGDLGTVNMLLEKHRDWEQELQRKSDLIQKIRQTTPTMSSLTTELCAALEQVQAQSDKRQAQLDSSRQLAEEFSDALESVLEWLPLAEARIKFCPILEDEDSIVRLAEDNEKFREDLKRQEASIEQLCSVGGNILQSCHVNCARTITHQVSSVHARWTHVLSRASSRSEELRRALNKARKTESAQDEIAAWLSDAQERLESFDISALPDDQAAIESLIKEHAMFHEELCRRLKDIDRLRRPAMMSPRLIPSRSLSSAATPGQPLDIMINSPSHERPLAPTIASSMMSLSQSRPDTLTCQILVLRGKWQLLWQVSSARKRQLREALDSLLITDSGKPDSFEFERWRQRCAEWFRSRKLRISDVFGTETLETRAGLNSPIAVVTRKQFIDALTSAQFHSSVAELGAVFDMFDPSQTGVINHRDVFKTILSGDQQNVRGSGTVQRPEVLTVLSDSELIAVELRQQILRCQCPTQFPVQKVDAGKYKFGDKGKLCLVRFVNSSVTVRVGGGWMNIQEFLDSVDPCRVRSRPNSVRSGGQFTPPGFSGQVTPPHGGEMSPTQYGHNTPPEMRPRGGRAGGGVTPVDRCDETKTARDQSRQQITSPVGAYCKHSAQSSPRNSLKPASPSDVGDRTSINCTPPPRSTIASPSNGSHSHSTSSTSAVRPKGLAVIRQIASHSSSSDSLTATQTLNSRRYEGVAKKTVETKPRKE